jgi:hypothetical protein
MKVNEKSGITHLDVSLSSTPDLRMRSLESRLEDGYQRIEQARKNGEDVAAWEDFWIDLLRQYESSALSLPEAA